MEHLPAQCRVLCIHVDYCHSLREMTDNNYVKCPPNNVTLMSLLTSVKELSGTLNECETNCKCKETFNILSKTTVMMIWNCECKETFYPFKNNSNDYVELVSLTLIRAGWGQCNSYYLL